MKRKAPKPESVNAAKEIATPVGFAHHLLGMQDNYKWQNEVIAPLELAGMEGQPPVNITFVGPNGCGKDDRLIPAAALWWVTTHKRGTVVITSKSDLQLTQQTIPALEKHRHKFDGYTSIYSPRYEMKTPSGGRIIAFVTNAASRIEGWHREPGLEGPLLLILNEAKSIDEESYRAWDRCTPSARMFISSAGPRAGRFWETHTKLKAEWLCFHAGLADCPHIDKEKIEYVIKTYGPNHPLTKSILHGDFMDQEDGDQLVCPENIVRNCLANRPRHRPGLRLAFCDFGEGTAENVIAIRDGNKVEFAATWRSADKEASAGRFIREFRKHGLKAEEVWGDAADKEMCDLLMDAGWSINRKNFGSEANDKEVYKSWCAEAWHETAASIRRCDVIIPDDDILIAQLTTRKKGIDARGRLSIEDKYDMKKPPRSLPSPDRADALCGALCVHDVGAQFKEPFRIPPEGIFGHMEAEEHQEALEELGAFAG